MVGSKSNVERTGAKYREEVTRGVDWDIVV